MIKQVDAWVTSDSSVFLSSGDAAVHEAKLKLSALLKHEIAEAPAVISILLNNARELIPLLQDAVRGRDYDSAQSC